jgi:hypothetical protein
MSDDIQRTLGDHGAQLTNLQREVAQIAENVRSLVAAENQREGGKKALWTIAAVAGATSSAIVSAAIKLWPK